MFQKKVYFLVKHSVKYFLIDRYFVIELQIILDQNIFIVLLNYVTSEYILLVHAAVLFEIIVHFQILLRYLTIILKKYIFHRFIYKLNVLETIKFVVIYEYLFQHFRVHHFEHINSHVQVLISNQVSNNRFQTVPILLGLKQPI